ncbi:lipocalin/fatty-acid binding family protein [Streptomyces sp. 4.24]|uniref:lipocalin/fatty-acid binding family protein n=1 Tax=Streptomyces tritrimontium TaxID=3406573 RepID=UPI003BB7D9F2
MSIAGRYEMISSDNYEEFLKATGVGLATRKLEASAKPTVTITQDGDSFTMRTATALKAAEVAFTLGREFVQETTDGRKAITSVTLGGNKLTEVQDLEGRTVTIHRSFSDDGMDAVFTAGAVVSNCSYKRI